MAITLERQNPTSMETAADLIAATERDGVEFLFAMFVDMHGKPCAKMVPVSAIDGLMADGAGFAGFAAGPMGQTPSSPDLLAMPDLCSYMPAPWRPGLGIIQCDPHVLGEPWPFAPRVILRRQLQRLADAGYTLKVGAEAEYFLVRRTDDGGIEVADAQDQAAAPCYDARALTRMYDHLTTVSRHMNTLGWANYANDHEDANGQFEQNFRYADPLTTADRVIVFRYMVHAPGRRGRDAGHLHAQAVLGPHRQRPAHAPQPVGAANDTELFADDDDARGLGMSSMGYSFIAGLLDHAQALAAVACPTVNSYKRLASPAPNSGRGLVARLRHLRGQRPDPHAAGARSRPGRGPLHRRLGQPLPGHQRPDRRRARRHRAGGSTPATRASSTCCRLDEHEATELGLRSMPMTLWHALEHLERDEVLREGLGKTPDGDYVDYFVATKRAEVRSSHAEVTPWEIDRYLQAF